MTAPRWPAPGTTFGPDRLDEVRALLREWPGRGVWECRAKSGRVYRWDPSCVAIPEAVAPGETWHYVGPHPSDPPDTQPAEAARTVEAKMWAFAWSADGGETWATCVGHDEHRIRVAHRQMQRSRRCTDVHKVRAALPLPVEPAVVVGEVSDG